ncbi:hypothetical protein SISSUDRAFT_1119203 [Sistotremastrum suecicum HHB10207 ss-3]|uniref:DUF6535 domain-containing protein n=1 Tax=Sistotremastrum suecicum HHB10207 ss-3 TaxID=1314776 RepID=A0A166DZ90_9AGAM|nr:hypothetical protein SISSUDRAFT_1119203 [Sistotremastrum suecicum HHB10207 ss-3]
MKEQSERWHEVSKWNEEQSRRSSEHVELLKEQNRILAEQSLLHKQETKSLGTLEQDALKGERPYTSRSWDDPAAWRPVFERIMETTRERVDVWRNGMDLTLIFIALFLTVITAFLIPSIQNVSPNPASPGSDPTMATAGTQNATDATPPPPRSDQAIYMFYFTSLVASIITAVLCVLGRQWIGRLSTAPDSKTYCDKTLRHIVLKVQADKLLFPILRIIEPMMVVSIALFVAGLAYQLWTSAFSFSEGIFIIKFTAGFSTVLLALLGLLIFISLCHAILHRDSPFESPFSKILGILARTWFRLDVKLGTIGNFDRYEKLRELCASGSQAEEQVLRLHGMEYLAQEVYAGLIADIADPDLLDRAVLSFLPTTFKDYELGWNKTRFEKPEMTLPLFNAVMRMLSVDSSPSVRLTVATQIRAMIKAHAAKYLLLTSPLWIIIRDRLKEIYEEAQRTDAAYRQTFFVTLIDLHTLLQLTGRRQRHSSIVDWSCAEVYLPIDTTIAKALKYPSNLRPITGFTSTLFSNAVELCYMLGSSGRTDELARIIQRLSLSEILRALLAQSAYTWQQLEPFLRSAVPQRELTLSVLVNCLAQDSDSQAPHIVNGRIMAVDLIGYLLPPTMDEKSFAHIQLPTDIALDGLDPLMKLLAFPSALSADVQTGYEKFLLLFVSAFPVRKFDNWDLLYTFVARIASNTRGAHSLETQDIASRYLSHIPLGSPEAQIAFGLLDKRVPNSALSDYITESVIRNCLIFAQNNDAGYVRDVTKRGRRGAVLCGLIQQPYFGWDALAPLRSAFLCDETLDFEDWQFLNGFVNNTITLQTLEGGWKSNMFCFLEEVVSTISAQPSRFLDFRPNLTSLTLQISHLLGNHAEDQSMTLDFLKKLVFVFVCRTCWKLSDKDVMIEFMKKCVAKGVPLSSHYLDVLHGLPRQDAFQILQSFCGEADHVTTQDEFEGALYECMVLVHSEHKEMFQAFLHHENVAKLLISLVRQSYVPWTDLEPVVKIILDHLYKSRSVLSEEVMALEKSVGDIAEVSVTNGRMNLLDFLADMRSRGWTTANGGSSSTASFMPDVSHLLSKLPPRNLTDKNAWLNGMDTLMHYISEGPLEKIRDVGALKNFLDRCIKERGGFASNETAALCEAFYRRTGYLKMDYEGKEKNGSKGDLRIDAEYW